jgi:hypothetical protein
VPTTPKSGPPNGWSMPPEPPPPPHGWNPPPGSNWEPTGWSTIPTPPPPPPRPTPEEAAAAAARLRERLRLFLITLVGLVVVWQLTLPFRLAGIALGVLAGWTGIRVLIGMSAERRYTGQRSRSTGVVLLGLAMTAVLTLILVAEAVFYPVVSDLERCEAGANTRTAQNTCQQVSKDRLQRLQDKLDDRTRH